jgi:hypothetical protein
MLEEDLRATAEALDVWSGVVERPRWGRFRAQVHVGGYSYTLQAERRWMVLVESSVQAQVPAATLARLSQSGRPGQGLEAATGDEAFDARFEVQASGPAALRVLSDRVRRVLTTLPHQHGTRRITVEKDVIEVRWPGRLSLRRANEALQVIRAIFEELLVLAPLR